MTLDEKIADSIAFIRKYAPIADKYGGYKVAFSGGKDSQVMLDLFRKSGVDFTAHYNVTTNDPPENVWFIRDNYPEVEFVHPTLTFLELIEKKKRLPMMDKRYCCKELKESHGKGFVAVGVRREESARRLLYQPIEFVSKNKKIRFFEERKMTSRRKVAFRPILEWTEADIWQYIEDNSIPVNPCYETSGRVGCIFCPFSSTLRLHWAKEHYPRYYRLLLRSIERIMQQGYMREFQPITAEYVFEWWASKQNAKMFFRQLKMDFNE